MTAPPDVAGLCKRLRLEATEQTGDWAILLFDAADALEAMAKERDLLKATVERLRDTFFELGQLKADVERLERNYDFLGATLKEQIAEREQAESALALAQRERDYMTNAGVIECAVRNKAVSEYMDHWEGRTLKAESELAALKGQTCQTCHFCLVESGGAMKQYCQLHDMSSDALGNRCGRWAKRETP
jgi:hypothetical protein